MYFGNYGLRKTWLVNCLESAVSEDASTGSMVNRPKDCFNLNGSALTIFSNQCQAN